MDAPNSSPDQEREGEQQPSELPSLSEKHNSQEASDHAPMGKLEGGHPESVPLTRPRSESLASQTSTDSGFGTAQLPMLLLTIAALSFATGSGNMTYLGDGALSTHVEGASRPRTRRSQVRLSSGSTHQALSTPMGVMRVQAYRWPEANRS